MRKILVALTACWMGAALAVPAHAQGSFGPGNGYLQGPSGGDRNTSVSANPATGEVVIFQHNVRQAAAVHCIGDGPRATLMVRQPGAGAPSSVAVAYEGAFMSEHPVINVHVRGTQSGWLGHGAAHGPMADESGTINVPIQGTPVAGETVEVVFGLQVHAGCLPHPLLLGLAGSRFVEGGRVVFSSVSIR